PDEQLRLFKKYSANWVGKELHERVQVNGEIGLLHAPIYHYSYRDLAEHLDTVNRFAILWAKEQNQNSKKPPAVLMLIIHPIIKIFECYIWKRGFLDGYRGLIIAGIAAFYVFLRDAKLYELQQKPCPEERGK
ncbi:MAG: glycosyltransferase family 2 protein, partial [bacterium]|nr:glycosyltransferase family 2 protein [bacterium]